MELVFLSLTILGIIIAIIFGYLQVVVPFIKGEVRFSGRFPFVETAEAVPAAKQRRRKRKKRQRFLIPGLAFGILIILFVLIRFLVFQAKAIERVPIAVINFTNHTGDEQFDYLCAAIPNLLIINLEQSKHLSVLTWERMRDLLKVLGKEDVSAVDENLGFEICKMDDIEAVITGSFTKAGNMFVTEVKVLDVASKKILKTSSSQGDGVASILKFQIDELSKDIARNVSLYERVATPTEMQVMEVTTTSIEAYNYFLKGREEFAKYYWADARKFLEKAIEIDSNFASAYYYLAISNHWLGDFEARNRAYEKAKALSGKATEKERLWIEAGYAATIEGDQEKSLRVIQELATKYPKEKEVHQTLAIIYRHKDLLPKAIEEFYKAIELDPYFGNAWSELGYTYARMGDYAKAIECLKRYASVSPGNANPFDSMGDIYLKMGQLDEALDQYKQAVFVKRDFGHSIDRIADIYGLREDYAEAMNWQDSLITIAQSNRQRAVGYFNKAFYGQLSGNINQAQCNLDTARMLLPIADTYRIALVEFLRSATYFHQGKFQLSQNHLKDCYDNLPSILVNEIFYNFFLGLIDLKQENLYSAKARLAAIRPLLAEADTQSKDQAQLFHDILYAEVLLAQDSIEKSIMVGQNTSKYRNEIPDEMFFVTPHIPRDVTARAYLEKGEIDKAILEYEKLVDPDPNKRNNFLIRPTWHYELAKLYAQRGLKAKATEQYEKFLDIWKNADEDLPEFIDAKNRLARLRAAT